MRDRDHEGTVSITVNGILLVVPTGMTLAAALLSDGVRSFRSSVTGQPRGPLCSMGSCFECGITVDGERHVRACIVEVRTGMVVVSDD